MWNRFEQNRLMLNQYETLHFDQNTGIADLYSAVNEFIHRAELEAGS